MMKSRVIASLGTAIGLALAGCDIASTNKQSQDTYNNHPIPIETKGASGDAGKADYVSDEDVLETDKQYFPSASFSTFVKINFFEIDRYGRDKKVGDTRTVLRYRTSQFWSNVYSMRFETESDTPLSADVPQSSIEKPIYILTEADRRLIFHPEGNIFRLSCDPARENFERAYRILALGACSTPISEEEGTRARETLDKVLRREKTPSELGCEVSIVSVRERR